MTPVHFPAQISGILSVPQNLILPAVIMGFSVVQSLFGVGLLVFGTPTLLLLGYSFETTLSYLLPSSIAISTAQVLLSHKEIEIRKEFFFYSVPSTLLGLVLILTRLVRLDVKALVGVFLLLTTAVRLSRPLKSVVGRFLRRHLNGYMAIMGFIHGVSNLGGGLLTVVVSSLYEKKRAIRANIAFCYLIFGVSQLLVLLILSSRAFSLTSLVLPILAILIFIMVGDKAYLRTSDGAYNRLLTSFMCLYGAVLLYSAIVNR